MVKAHGSSDEYLFYFTIKQAEQFVENKAVDKMIEEFEKINKKAWQILYYIISCRKKIVNS